MNKVSNPVEMEYKRQTTVLVTIFVLIGMIFLVPGITEKAQAGVNAQVGMKPCKKSPCSLVLFTLLSKSLKQGQWITNPTPSASCTPGCYYPLKWETKGDPIGSTEEGSVRYQIENSVTKSSFTATFTFKNPATGVIIFSENKCGIGTTPTYSGSTCSVSSKTAANAVWTYTLVNPW